jgi:hypothetical protein
MVSGNDKRATKDHPVVFVLEKYLIKYFHELLGKDVSFLKALF